MRIRDDAGSVLVETAIALPVILLVIIGGLDMGLAMVEEMRLTFATNGAATLEAAAPGTGASWGRSQMPDASFTVTSPGCVAGTLSYRPVLLPAEWFNLAAAGCAPVIPPAKTS
jgi:Flp pilus assembly protein TadG